MAKAVDECVDVLCVHVYTRTRTHIVKRNTNFMTSYSVPKQTYCEIFARRLSDCDRQILKCVHPQVGGVSALVVWMHNYACGSGAGGTGESLSTVVGMQRK